MVDDFIDVDEILFNGSKEEISNLSCPYCGGELYFNFSLEARERSVKCCKCGVIIRGHGFEGVPNCVKFFGSEYIIRK